jgi:hypothetical protein
MTNKLILTCLLFFIGVTISNGQVAEIKDANIILNGNSILKFEKSGLNESSVYSLDSSGEELIMLKFVSYGMSTLPNNKPYFTANFLTEKKKLFSTDFSHLNKLSNMNKITLEFINWLLKEKVLDSTGKINSSKLDVFFEKYNEQTETIIKIES